VGYSFFPVTALSSMLPLAPTQPVTLISATDPPWRYRDGAGNTVEENSSVFSLIQMR